MKVLLVEDQRDVLAGWQEGFASFAPDFELVFAECAAEAVRLLDDGGIGVAFVDLGLPWDTKSEDPAKRITKNEHGLKLLLLLRSKYKIPTIALTGASAPDVLRMVKVRVVAKPVKDFQREIIERLRGMCEPS